VLVNRTSDPAVCGDNYSFGNLADGASVDCHATYTSSDDAEVTFRALATGVRASQANDYGSGKADWSLKPKYRLKINTIQDNPVPGTAVPAGNPIRLHGTVTNMSRSDVEKVGPLYPELGGAAGVESFAWDATGTDPESFVPDDVITLQPGEEHDFTVRVTTSWSDPMLAGSAARTNSGGTRAILTFTPWAKYTDENGVEHDVDDSEIEATRVDDTPTPLVWNVPVDDSVVIPHVNWAAYAGAFTVGGMNGVKNAASSLLRAPLDLVNFSASSIHAIASYQDQVWDDMTPAERDAFANDVAGLAVHILKRNAAKAAMTPGDLYTAANTAALQRMTDLENQWQVGDYTQTVEAWSEGGADAVSQVVLPIAAAKLARSATAAAALERAQTAIQASFDADIASHLGSVTKVEDVLPVLEELANGTELTADQLSTLYGISPEELAELQKIADKYQFLLTVRSRHASSLQWIAEHNAMLKPEAIKIKTVSELDSRLGYPADDIGSLVFKKPVPLVRFEQAGAGADLGAITDQYLTEQGFDLASQDAIDARTRIKLRVDEWKDYEAKYKKWSNFSGDGSTGEGFVDVTYNYKGNAIDDTVRQGVGKEVGFRLRPINGDANTLTVQFYNAKVGEWVPVTGDIDPIAFTHLDGSPLSMAEHADVVDAMADNPLLQGQHPESATFVGQDPATHDGVAFVSKQFKTGPDGLIEPGLQIAPGHAPPRVVRLDAKRSYWNNPFDYRITWDGGYVYTGDYTPRAPGPMPAPDWGGAASLGYTEAGATAPHALPQSVGGDGPSFGRCVINYSNSPTSKPLVLTGDNTVVQVGANGATQTTDYATQCLTPDPNNASAPLTLDVRAGTGITTDSHAGDTRVDVSQTPADGSQGTQFQAGQVVDIGAGTDHAETDTIVGFGSLLLLHPLRYDHASDEAIVVVKPAPPHPPDMLNIAKPKITGTALVGRRVSASAGAWNPLPTTVSYQWLANNRPIAGATHSRLVLTAALAGKQLRVAVTANAILYSPVASDSAAVVVKFASTTSLKLHGHRATIHVAAEGTRPTGTIVLTVGKRRLRVKLTARARGTVVVTLPRGRYKVKATYLGSATVAGSASPPRLAGVG
jgi:hypothetical protein